MKNLIILGLVALLLFSVSAALSLWLNQSKTDQNAEKDKDKAAGKKPGDVKETPEQKPPGKAETPAGPGPGESAQLLKDREAKLERRLAQLDLVIRDIQSQRESTEATLRLVMAELKNVSVEKVKLDRIAEDLKKQQTNWEPIEAKNIEKMASWYDAMSPEAAAPILKQMAESGRMDMAAKILVRMKDRNVGRVLEAMNDPALADQLFAKVRTLRGTAPPVTPAGGPGATPAPGTGVGAPVPAPPVVPAKGP